MRNRSFSPIFMLTLTLLLLVVITATGVFTFSADHTYTYVNRFGDAVVMTGAGLYADDSFFKAVIFTGTDAALLLVFCPVLALALWRDWRHSSLKSRLVLASLNSLTLYYAVSVAFGVSFNRFHLLYIALVGLSLFIEIRLVWELVARPRGYRLRHPFPWGGLRVFLVLGGVFLFVAWLPDVISALMQHRSLALIEVYTTEVTYVLDMGIISPLFFICLVQLRRQSRIGYVLCAVLLTVGAVIGVVLIGQSLCQMIVGIDIPLAALLTKTATFVFLAGFSLYFLRCFYRQLEIDM